MAALVVPFVRRASPAAKAAPVADELYFEMPVDQLKLIELTKDFYIANYELLTLTCSIMDAAEHSDLMTDDRWPGRLLFNAMLPADGERKGLYGLYQVDPRTLALQRLRERPLPVNKGTTRP